MDQEERARRRAAAIQRINEARTIDLDRYQEEGCNDRFAYFEMLAEDHGLKVHQVAYAASIMGPDEDFDGLKITLEDHGELVGAC